MLVAEDSPVHQKVAQHMLEGLGYVAEIVGNGRETNEAIGGTQYSAVLMDLQMPEMDGLEATRTLRAAEPLGTHIPVVALTTDAPPGVKESCLAAGMDDYLVKPLRRIELEQKLARWTGASP